MELLEVFARKRTLDEFDLYGDELTPVYQPSNRKVLTYINNVVKDEIQ